MNNGFDTTWNPFMAQTWNRYLPPIRPSHVVVELYAKILDELRKKVSSPDILVLGATPEIRDLILDRELSLTVVDYSEVNYRTLSLLMRHIPVREKFINQNWVKMTPDGQYDMIIGDHSLNVISSKSIKAILSKTHHYMKKNALLVVRTWIRPTDVQPDLLSVIEEYRETLQPMLPFYPTCVGPIQSFLYDKKSESLCIGDMYAHLRKLYNQGILNDKEWQSVEILSYENVTLKLYLPLQQDFLDLAKQLFRVNDIFYPKEPFSKYCPIFVFEKL